MGSKGARGGQGGSGALRERTEARPEVGDERVWGRRAEPTTPREMPETPGVVPPASCPARGHRPALPGIPGRLPPVPGSRQRLADTDCSTIVGLQLRC